MGVGWGGERLRCGTDGVALLPGFWVSGPRRGAPRQRSSDPPADLRDSDSVTGRRLVRVVAGYAYLRLPSDSHQTPIRLPSDSHQTPNFYKENAFAMRKSYLPGISCEAFLSLFVVKNRCLMGV